MGSFLDKPRTEKETDREEHEALDARAALSSMQGWRVSQEDAHLLALPMPPQDSAAKAKADDSALQLYGVFDGHGGKLVSNEVAKRLIPALRAHKSWPDAAKGDSKAAETALIESFLQVDDDLRRIPELETGQDMSGSTGVVVMLTTDEIICANT